MFNNGWGSFNNEDTFTFSPGSIEIGTGLIISMALYGVNITRWVVALAERMALVEFTTKNPTSCSVLLTVFHWEADVLRPKKLSGANHLTHGDRELIMQRNWNNLCKNSVNFEGLRWTERHQCSSTWSSLTFEIGCSCCCVGVLSVYWDVYFESSSI